MEIFLKNHKMWTLRCFVYLCTIFGTVTVIGFPANSIRGTISFKRNPRGIKEWNLFSKTTTVSPVTTTVPPKLPNNLDIGHCEDEDKVMKAFE